jgi:MarR family transcriptional regulator, organic hydroperoxide resistance regulator
MGECSEGDQLNQQLFDACAQLMGGLLAELDKQAGRFGLPVFAVKAMHWLDGGIAMKELGRRMRCDPSFVTAIADSLEKRGLGRREPNPADRRIKNLVLTAEGLALKERLERAAVDSMPWCRALDLDERKSLLALVRKLVDAQASVAAATAGAPRRTRTEHDGEVTGQPSPAPAGIAPAGTP